MKEIIHNNDNLTDNEITEIIKRTKTIIINNNNLLIANENNKYLLIGGHLEKNESLIECLKREVLEETGITVSDNEIKGPYIKITYCNKDYPNKGNNQKSEIYFYAIETNKKPNLEKTNYDPGELANNFKLEWLPLDESISIIKNNIPNNPKNKKTAPDMILAIEEYLKKYKS